MVESPRVSPNSGNYIAKSKDICREVKSERNVHVSPAQHA